MNMECMKCYYTHKNFGCRITELMESDIHFNLRMDVGCCLSQKKVAQKTFGNPCIEVAVVVE